MYYHHLYDEHRNFGGEQTNEQMFLFQSILTCLLQIRCEATQSKVKPNI